MVKKVITNLDSSKASGPDSIPQWWTGAGSGLLISMMEKLN